MSAPEQLPLEFDHRPAFGGADFLIADSNSAAVAWIDRWPDWPSPVLAVHGPEGCGKSHLAEVFRAKSAARALTHAQLAADEPRDPASAGGAWIVEDTDRYLETGSPTPLFHLLNQVREGGGTLLVSGRTPPARWPVELPDLRSRLNAATAVAIGAPDDRLLAAVLVKMFADRQLRVGTEVVEFALKRMERSFGAARELVADLDAAALAEQRKITVPLVRKVLESSAES